MAGLNAKDNTTFLLTSFLCRRLQDVSRESRSHEVSNLRFYIRFCFSMGCLAFVKVVPGACILEFDGRCHSSRSSSSGGGGGGKCYCQSETTRYTTAVLSHRYFGGKRKDQRLTNETAGKPCTDLLDSDVKYPTTAHNSFPFNLLWLSGARSHCCKVI